MALIKCPDCGKEVSDTAQKCINCGRIMKKSGIGNIVKILITSFLIFSAAIIVIILIGAVILSVSTS